MSNVSHIRSGQWFVLIGAMAAATHYLVAVGLVHVLDWPPAWCNVWGFFAAFPVSYWGHRLKTFAHHQTPHHHALPRFFMVALLGFSGNHLLVLAGLHFTLFPFWVILGVVMVIIAISTYWLSHYWAFRKWP